MSSRWSREDRQRFADRDILRASRVPGKRRPAPNASEWLSEAEDDSGAPNLPEDDLRRLDGHTGANPAIEADETLTGFRDSGDGTW